MDLNKLKSDLAVKLLNDLVANGKQHVITLRTLKDENCFQFVVEHYSKTGIESRYIEDTDLKLSYSGLLGIKTMIDSLLGELEKSII